MSANRNERKINTLLHQMEKQTGYDVHMNKIKEDQAKREELSPYLRDLSQIEQQDPLRVAPIPKENTREERKIEELRQKERENIMARVYRRQRMRTPRTYS